MSRSICLLLLLAAVPMMAGAQDAAIPVAKISLPDPAYIGMPIWMQIESSTGRNIRYPSSTTPNDFYCNEIEVKQGARLLAPLKGVPPPRNGAACGFLGVEGITVSRLPIHLQYQLIQSGTYLVRFTRHEYRGSGKMQVAEQSEWTALHLRVAPPGMVETWLRHQLASLPVSPGPLLGDALPSLLASRDNRVLRLMIETTYQGCPPRVWGCPESVLAAYAAESLKLFDPAQVRPQLLLAINQRGSSDALAYTLNPRDYAQIAPQIVSATFPKLHSSVPAEVEASVHTLYVFLRDAGYDLPRDTITRIDGAMKDEVEFVVSQKNENAARWLAQFLAKMEPATGRPLLWKLVEAHLATEQSLICLTWFRDPSDLPRLAEIAKQKDPSDPSGYDSYASVVGAMKAQYGTVSRPYLRDVLASSKQTWVRTAAAQGLVEMNDRAGWEFFLDVVKQRPFYRDEMVRWLADRFPETRNSDEVALATFLQSKMSSASNSQ